MEKCVSHRQSPVAISLSDNLNHSGIEISLDVLPSTLHILADEKISIEISDNGKGIPEEVVDHIFTPFFTTRKDGSGIGLSLARQVMQMHNGSINVNTREGKYTTFTLFF